MVPLCSPRAELRGWYGKQLNPEFCTGIKSWWSKSGHSLAVAGCCGSAAWLPTHHFCWPSLFYSFVVAVRHISLTWDFSAHRTPVIPFKIITWAVSYTIYFCFLLVLKLNEICRRQRGNISVSYCTLWAITVKYVPPRGSPFYSFV